jgi:hypothetical protein
MKSLKGNSQMARRVLNLFVVMIALILTSCLYVPMVHTSGESGISEDSLSRIHVGETTKWGKIFEDTIVASAIIDRIIHHAHIFYINGSSYRIKDKLKRVI